MRPRVTPETRMSNVRLFLAGCLIAAFSAGLLLPRVASAETSVKIGMAVPDVANFLLYVAKEKGFFKEEGLDAELVQFPNDSAAAQGLTAGAVLVNNASIFPVIDSYIAGRDLVAIWSVSNMPGYVWYGQSKYSSIKDLKGSGKIGVSNIGAMTYHISNWAVARSGLNPKTDVTFIALGGPLERLAALKAGQVDAIPATPPGIFVLEKEGFKPLLSLKDLMPEFSYEVFSVRKSNLVRDEKQLQQVIRATIKAKRWAMENRDEATTILMKNLGASSDQADVYRKTVDFALPFFPADGAFPTDSINVFLGFYKDQNEIKEIPPQSAFIDYRFYEYFKRNPLE